MKRPFQWLLLITLAGLIGFVQAPGFAEIVDPGAGALLSGLVTIRGTATHPNFQRYDLSFAYDPNPTDTWFPIAEPFKSPVQDDRLVIWDTNGISDGDYQLRLRVWTDAGLAFEVIVGGLKIRNYSSVGSIPDAPQSTAAPQITPQPTLTPVVKAVDPGKQEFRIPPTTRAFALGGAAAIAGFGIVGVYMALRKRALAGWGNFRMRRVHHRQRNPHRPGRSGSR